jgi:hypothetical protein
MKERYSTECVVFCRFVLKLLQKDTILECTIAENLEGLKVHMFVLSAVYAPLLIPFIIIYLIRTSLYKKKRAHGSK